MKKTSIYSPAAKRVTALTLLLTLVQAGFLSISILFLAEVIDKVLSDGNIPASPAIFMLVFAVLAALFAAAVPYISQKQAVLEEGKIRKLLIGQLMKLGIVSRNQSRSGSVVSAVTDGVERAVLFRFSFLGSAIGTALIPILVVVIIGTALDWKSAGFMALAIPAIPLLVRGFQKAFQKVSGASRVERQKLAANYLDAFQGLTTMQLLGAAPVVAQNLAERGEANRRSIMKLLSVNQLVILVVDAVFSLAMTVLASYLAISGLIDDRFTVGEAIAMVLLSTLMLEPLNKVGEFFYIGLGGIAAAKELKRVMAEEPATSIRGSKELVKQNLEDSSSTENPPVLEFERVSFGYGDTEVLSDVNLQVRAGDTVAIVGRSGAGKSTILNLIQRHLESSAGAIKLAGEEITDLKITEARRFTAMVSQSTFLFSGSVAENLRLAKPDASDDELWDALEVANLAEEIRRLPAGIETQLGERAITISGGQAQRISIARAVLSNAQLLLLDEPTAQVDLESEAKIISALEKATAGRTVITVAHRETAVRNADAIYQLVAGRLEQVR